MGRIGMRNFTKIHQVHLYEAKRKGDLELVKSLIKNEFNRDVSINAFDSELDRYFCG